MRSSGKHYFIFWSAAPDLLITKLPERTQWRRVMKAMTAIARMYGIYRKEMHLLEGLHAGQEGYENITDVFTTRSKTRLPTFDLWEWRGDKFVVVRERTRE